jgi:hypothetical protein
MRQGLRLLMVLFVFAGCNASGSGARSVVAIRDDLSDCTTLFSRTYGEPKGWRPAKRGDVVDCGYSVWARGPDSGAVLEFPHDGRRRRLWKVEGIRSIVALEVVADGQRYANYPFCLAHTDVSEADCLGWLVGIRGEVLISTSAVPVRTERRAEVIEQGRRLVTSAYDRCGDLGPDSMGTVLAVSTGPSSRRTVVVEAVCLGTAADATGLNAGDQLVAIGGEPVYPETISQALERCRRDEQQDLLVRRGGAALRLPIRCP